MMTYSTSRVPAYRKELCKLYFDDFILKPEYETSLNDSGVLFFNYNGRNIIKLIRRKRRHFYVLGTYYIKVKQTIKCFGFTMT